MAADDGPIIPGPRDVTCWVHCNACYLRKDENKDLQLFMTSCAHVFCVTCVGDREDYCLVCKASCRMMKVAEESPEYVMIYFSDLAEKILEFANKFEKVRAFQQDQRKKLFIYESKKIQNDAIEMEREIESLERECAQLRLMKMRLERNLPVSLPSQFLSPPPSSSLMTPPTSSQPIPRVGSAPPFLTPITATGPTSVSTSSTVGGATQPGHTSQTGTAGLERSSSAKRPMEGASIDSTPMISPSSGGRGKKPRDDVFTAARPRSASPTPSVGTTALNSYITPGRLTLRTPPFSGRIGVIPNSRETGSSTSSPSDTMPPPSTTPQGLRLLFTPRPSLFNTAQLQTREYQSRSSLLSPSASSRPLLSAPMSFVEFQSRRHESQMSSPSQPHSASPSSLRSEGVSPRRPLNTSSSMLNNVKL